MSGEDWFASWFDTPWYHLLYAHRDEPEAAEFIANLVSCIPLQPGSYVLDAACGKGRHARMLHQIGMITDGFDLSAKSIAAANEYAAEGLRFFVHDMRYVFRQETYDVVFNLFSSFGYFETDEMNQQALHAMVCSVKPGGFFVLDYLNPEYVVKHLVSKEIINRGEIQFHISRRIEKGQVIKDIQFLDRQEHHHYQERVRLINYRLFCEWIAETGLVIQKVFGSYALDPFSSGTSSRIIFVCQKNA